jgi:hypothetical protein
VWLFGPLFHQEAFHMANVVQITFLSHAQKQPNLQDFLNQDKNNNKPNPKS